MDNVAYESSLFLNPYRIRSTGREVKTDGLDENTEGLMCAHCGHRPSLWEFHPSDQPDGTFTILCGQCVLYSTVWGRRRVVRLEEFAKTLEEDLRKQGVLEPAVYNRDSAGKVSQQFADIMVTTLLTLSGVADSLSTQRLVTPHKGEEGNLVILK